MSLQEKINSLTPRGVVMLMIESLENPATKINMGSFGHVGSNGDCFGCAATNALLRLAEREIDDKVVDALAMGGWRDFAKMIGEKDVDLVECFELAINHLRCGNIRQYNLDAIQCGLPELPPWPTSLPYLDTKNYQNGLKFYRQYAEELSDVREN